MDARSDQSAQLASLLVELIPYVSRGFLLTDTTHRIIEYNESALQMLGIDCAPSIGSDLSDFLPPKVVQYLLLPGNIHTEFNYHDSSFKVSKWEHIIGTEFSGIFYFLDYAGQSKESAEINALEERIEDLRNILQCSYDGIYVTDRDGLTLFVNQSHERISGIPSQRVIGRYMKDLVEEGVFSYTLTERVVAAKKPITVSQIAKNGRNYIITGTPIFNAAGAVKKVVTNVRDVTELTRLSAELERSKEIKESYKKDLFSETERDIIINSLAFRKTMSLAKKVASKNSTVLILGETGVGKEVVAKYIHHSSPRRQKDYLKINCASIPTNLLESELFGYVKGAFTGANQNGKMGAFELANGGTLFLDEIGELPLAQQASLLRVLQDGEIVRVGDTKRRKIDVRIVTATNRDLEDMIHKNQFRMDLYYRLNVISIEVPPLRERVDDIPALTEFFLKKLNEKYRTFKVLTPGFTDYLCRRDWPGNVRELQNFIERQYVISDEDTVDAPDVFEVNRDKHSSSGIRFVLNEVPTMKSAVTELKRSLLQKALDQGGTTYKAARLLGISQSTFSRQYSEYFGETDYTP